MSKQTNKHLKDKKEQQTPRKPPAAEIVTKTPAPTVSTEKSAAEPVQASAGNGDARRLDEEKVGNEQQEKKGNENDKDKLRMIEFKIYVDLYKFFLRISLSVSVFFLSVVGGLLAIFYSAAMSVSGRSLIDTMIRPAKLIFLATPFIISCVLTTAFGVGAGYWWFSTRKVNQKLRDKAVEVKLITRPFFHLLTFVLAALTFIFLFVSILLGRMMAHYSLLFCQGCALG